MATNVTAAAAHIAYGMQPPESLHRTKYQIKAKKNQDLEHTELEMLITMNVHIPLPNPNPNPNQQQRPKGGERWRTRARRYNGSVVYEDTAKSR